METTDTETNEEREVALTILRDFMRLLSEAGLSKEEVAKQGFLLSIDIIQRAPHIVQSVGATPPAAGLKLKAAVLLKAARMSA